MFRPIFAVSCSFTLVLLTATTPTVAQNASPLSASDFNTKVGPINDALTNLYQQLQNPSLDMSQAAKLIGQQSALRNQMNQLWSQTQEGLAGSQRQLQQQAIGYERNNRQAGLESALVGSQIDLANNVAKYPTKAELEQNKDQLSQNWEATYGSRLKPFGDEFAAEKEDLFRRIKDKYGVEPSARIGTSNPYTGEAYYKYYDDKGNLVAAQWANDAAGWQKWTDDVNASVKRLRDQRDNYDTSLGEFTNFKNTYQSTRATLDNNFGAVTSLGKRVDFVGTWTGKDNVGKWLKLVLRPNGTTRYTWGSTSTEYDGAGRWEQVGSRITMRTNDGQWSHQSTITDQFQLEFVETSSTGRTFRNYLSR